MDNLNTHHRKALVDRYGEEEGDVLWKRFTVHYTPKHGSWLNQAEIEISLLARQCLGKRRIGDLTTLTQETRAWNQEANRQSTRIDWKFNRVKAREEIPLQSAYHAVRELGFLPENEICSGTRQCAKHWRVPFQEMKDRLGLTRRSDTKREQQSNRNSTKIYVMAMV